MIQKKLSPWRVTIVTGGTQQRKVREVSLSCKVSKAPVADRSCSLLIYGELTSTKLMEGSRRLDARLDLFLRRNLSQEDYERVFTAEHCVVISPEEKRVHRFAVLGHTALYTVDYPPRKFKTIFPLKDISSMRTVR